MLESAFHNKFCVITSQHDARISVVMDGLDNGVKLLRLQLCALGILGEEKQTGLFSGGKQKLEPETQLDPGRRFVVQCYSEIWTTSDDLRRAGAGELLLLTYYLQAQKTPQWTHSRSKPDRAVLLSAPPTNV